MKNISIFLILFQLVFLTSCIRPVYKKLDKLNDNNETNSSETVKYWINDNFNPNELNCVAIGEIKDFSNVSHFKDIKKSYLIRQSLFGLLSIKNYQNIKLSRVDNISKKYNPINNRELLKFLNCDAIIIGSIIKFDSDYFLTYSVTSIELELKLIDRNSKTLWSAKHKASSHEGSIPLSPISLLSGIYLATNNTYDEKAFQMIDMVSRRLMNTLPEKGILDLNNEIIANFKNEFDGKELLTLDNDINPDNYISNGDYEKALTFSQNLIATNSKNPINYIYASKSEFMLNNYSSAIDYAIKAISNGYESYDVYSILGMSYLKTNNNKLAYASFIKALEYKNESSLTNFNFAAIEEINQNIISSSNHYYKSGIISINENNNFRLYNSLKSLKRLSTKNNYSKDLYLKLGNKINHYLNSH